MRLLQGANQAAAAAKLGCPTLFIGQVGTDANASMLRDSLHGSGVDLSLLREVEGPCGTALILLQKSGEAPDHPMGPTSDVSGGCGSQKVVEDLRRRHIPLPLA